MHKLHEFRKKLIDEETYLDEARHLNQDDLALTYVWNELQALKHEINLKKRDAVRAIESQYADQLDALTSRYCVFLRLFT